MVRYSSTPTSPDHSSQQPVRHAQRFGVLVFLSLMILTPLQQAAIAHPYPPTLSTTQVTQTQPKASEPRLPRSVRRQVQRDLAQRLNVPRRDLHIVSASRETWADGCLGLGAYNERCTTATVEGWRIEVSNGQQTWFYRTDLTAQVRRIETTDQSNLPPDVSDRLLQTIAQQVGVPVVTLKITETQPRTWDGCMGIYEPGQVCTQIAISGYRVIVAGANQSWVYHISQDGSRIVQNSTASGSRGDIAISFIPTDGQQADPIDEPTDQPVIFRLAVSGGLLGTTTERVLLADGTLYHRTGRSPSQPSTPIVEKRLSPQQVQQFQHLLEQQKLPNLNGLRYLTDAALADYPTTTLQAMGSTVEYIDLAPSDLPPALQTVIQAWAGL